MHQARRLGDRTLALVKRAGVWEPITWRQSLELMPARVMGLFALGFQKGDTVGIASRTRKEWSDADLAILAAGGVTIGLYPSASLPEIIHKLIDTFGISSDNVEVQGGINSHSLQHM
ncbi:MAG: hypothetical protein CVU52_03420, partial [Deltaproteobacteria bacterium HGW-Deltaproteobacteria-10]